MFDDLAEIPRRPATRPTPARLAAMIEHVRAAIRIPLVGGAHVYDLTTLAAQIKRLHDDDRAAIRSATGAAPCGNSATTP